MASSSRDDALFSQLPEPLVRRLREIIRSVRKLQWTRGLLAVFLAGAGSVLVIMGVDAAFAIESVPPRVALSLAGLGVTLFTAWHKLVRPLSRRITLRGVARWLESRHPELQERISTAVELAGAPGGADAGSDELLQEVVREAVKDADKLDPVTELKSRPLTGLKRSAALAAGTLVLLVAVWPKQVPRLLARAFAPLSDFGNAWADRIRVLTESQTVAVGEPLNIEAAINGKAERVELVMTAPDGKETVEMMSPDPRVPVKEGENGVALRLPMVEKSFTARVRAGRALSASFEIKAVPRPELRGMTLTYDFPDYTGRPDVMVKESDGAIAAPAGTRVTVAAEVSRPVTAAEVTLAQAALPAADVVIEKGANPEKDGAVVRWSTVLAPGMQTTWSMMLSESPRLAGRTGNYPVRSTADAAPTVVLETPAQAEMELRPIEKLPLTYSVMEDFGLSAVRLRIRPAGRPEYFLPAPMPVVSEGAATVWKGTAPLLLGSLDLKDVGEIRVAVVASDTLPADQKGPQAGESREILIRVRRDARSLVEQTFLAQHEELQRMMDKAKRELNEAQWRMNDKADRLKNDERLHEDVLKQIEESGEHAAAAREALENMAQRMKDTAFARQSKDVENVAQRMAKSAEEKAKAIPLTDGKEERSKLAEQAKKSLDEAMKTLDEEQRKLQESREDAKNVARLADLAERQEELAQQATAAQKSAASEASAAEQTDPADPTNPTDPATAQAAEPAEPANAAQPTAENPAPAAQAAETAETPQTAQAPAPPKPLTPEEQRAWLEEQKRVAERARELTSQNQGSNPEAHQAEVKASAKLAEQLAAAATALAKQQDESAAAMKAADSPAAVEQAAAKQQELAGAAEALRSQMQELHKQASAKIEQSTDAQDSAWRAQTSFETAAAESAESGKELAENSSAAKAKAQAEAEAKAKAQESPAGDGSPPAAAGESGEKPPVADTAGDSTASATAAAEVEAQGKEKAATSAQAAGAALTEAAAALADLSKAFTGQAAMMADHAQSLREGSEQAGQAAEKASGESNDPDMKRGAESARQAAARLAQAASSAMNSRGISDNAKTPQTSGPPPPSGQSTAQEGQGQGRQGGDILQSETATQGLPPELAKLGLSADDWMKLKGVLAGLDGADTDKVPEEYRELVKAYFGALSRGDESIIER